MNYNKYIVAAVLGIVGMTVSNIYAEQPGVLQKIASQITNYKLSENSYERKLLGITNEGNYRVQYFYVTGEKLTDPLVVDDLYYEDYLLEDNYINGLVGRATFWYKGGTPCFEQMNTPRAKDYKRKSWYKNGQQALEQTNSKELAWHFYGEKKLIAISDDTGIVTSSSWYPNGQKEQEIKTEEDQSKLIVSWYPSGGKMAEYSKKNEISSFIEWYENGYKKLEVSYSSLKHTGKAWNEKGVLLEDTLRQSEQYTFNPVFERKLLKEESNGYLVQDFFKTGQKRTDSYWLTNKEDVTNNKLLLRNCDNPHQLSVVGVYTQYTDQGQLECKINFLNDSIDDYVAWFENGQKKEEKQGSSIDGNKQFYQWHANGQMARLVNQKIGVDTSWYEDGSIMEIQLHNPAINHKIVIEKYKTGKVARVYFKTNSEPSIFYAFGWNEQGFPIDYYIKEPIAEKNILLKVNFRDYPFRYKTDYELETNLTVTHWHKAKKVIESVFDTETNNGTVTQWYENGSIAAKGQYENYTKKMGIWQYFYDDGKPQVQGEFLDGKPVGIWTYWDKEGNKTTEEKSPQKELVQ